VTTQNLQATSSTQQAAQELTLLARRLASVIGTYRGAGSPPALELVVSAPTPSGLAEEAAPRARAA
jgi:hypothetical protein